MIICWTIKCHGNTGIHEDKDNIIGPSILIFMMFIPWVLINGSFVKKDKKLIIVGDQTMQ